MHVPALLLGAVLAAASAAAQAGSVRTLVRTGDVLPNGWTVQTVFEHGVDDDGRWAAVVRTTEPLPDNDAIIGSNGLFLFDGGTLPGGEVIDDLRHVAVGPTGQLGIAYLARDPLGGLGTHRFRVGGPSGSIVISSGDVVDDPSLPAGTTLQSLQAVQVAHPYALSVGDLSVPGSSIRRTLMRHEWTGTGWDVEVLLLEGDVPPGCPGPVLTIGIDPSLDTDGDYSASVTFAMGSGSGRAAFSDGECHFATGTPGPFPGSVWAPVAALGTSARGPRPPVVSSEFEQPDGSIRGAIMNGDGLLILQPNPITPAPDTLANLRQTDLAALDNGLPVFASRLGSGDGVCVGLARIYSVSDPTDEGFNVLSLPALSAFGIEASPSGRNVTFRATLATGELALLIAERDTGTTVACGAAPNSTGVPGRILGIGSDQLDVYDLTLFAFDLPQSAFGYMNTSNTFGFIANPGGSAGNLCLGGSIGRYISQIGFSGDEGRIVTTVDYADLPQPTGSASAVVGETWGFQLWHRDAAPGGGATSNFTQAISVTLR